MDSDNYASDQQYKFLIPDSRWTKPEATRSAASSSIRGQLSQEPLAPSPVSQPYADSFSHPYQRPSVRVQTSQASLQRHPSHGQLFEPAGARLYRPESEGLQAVAPGYVSPVAPVRRSPQDGPASSQRRWEDMKVDEATPEKRKKSILGLSVVWFWGLIALFVVILAVGIGAGVAVGMSNSKATTTAGQGPTPVGQGVVGVTSPAPINPYCPGGNGTEIVPYDASGSAIVFNQEQPMRFRMMCNTYWPSKAGENNQLRDIMIVYAPDMYTCMNLCAAYNQDYSNAVGDDVSVGGGICVAVALIKGPAQFCHLQNATGINDTSAAFGLPVDSAVLSGNWSRLTSDQQTLQFGGNLPAGRGGGRAG